MKFPVKRALRHNIVISVSESSDYMPKYKILSSACFFILNLCELLTVKIFEKL